MTLTSLIPGPSLLYRIAAYALLAASLVAFGWFKGSEHWHGVLIEAQAKALTEGVRIVAARAKVTTVVETKYLPQIVRQQVITETIVKEVNNYVPPTDPDLSGGFRVYHDAAAAGRVPDRTAIRDAAAVPAEDAARTVAENYGICRADQLKLQELQEWVIEQGKVR